MAMAAWLRASAFLLLGSALAPSICYVVAGWLLYVLRVRPQICRRPGGAAPPSSSELQVIACGFSRTGTLSLSDALEILGFPCLHGLHMCHPTRANLFMKAYKSGNPKDWRNFVKGFAAIADYPAACAYKELSALFPNAKIILTLRDANKWYDSFSQTLMRYSMGLDHKIFKIVPIYGAKCASLSMHKQFFDGKIEDRNVCVRAFLKHIDDVKSYVPPDNLLVYDIEMEDGWGTLCKFLNVPIPSVPFPHSNSRSNITDVFNSVGRLYTWVFTIYILIVACAFMYIT